MLIQFALQLHARGEEDTAGRRAIGQGETDPELAAAAIDLTSWARVLAAAIESGTARLEAGHA